MKILLTNDDSHRSPLLELAYKAASKIGDVTIVVPKHEQSWKGKSLTRFGYLHLESIQLFDTNSYTIDGTPADCVNIAIHHLFNGKKPDLVLSGINAGLNAGTGFVLSSGTVGACLEANISGVPAIALSQHFDVETREHYINSYSIPDETLKRIKFQTEVTLEKLFDVFLANSHLLTSMTTWNVNLPFFAADNFPVEVTSMGKSIYGTCYRMVDSFASGENNNLIIKRFEHDLVDYSEDESPNCDSRVLYKGSASVTPIDLHTLGQVDQERHLKLQALFGS
jgi:5'/3'-nucleotidase SurE